MARFVAMLPTKRTDLVPNVSTARGGKTTGVIRARLAKGRHVEVPIIAVNERADQNIIR